MVSGFISSAFLSGRFMSTVAVAPFVSTGKWAKPSPTGGQILVSFAEVERDAARMKKMLLLCDTCYALVMSGDQIAATGTGGAIIKDVYVKYQCPWCHEGTAKAFNHRTELDGDTVTYLFGYGSLSVESMRAAIAAIRLAGEDASPEDVAAAVGEVAPELSRIATWIRSNPVTTVTLAISLLSLSIQIAETFDSDTITPQQVEEIIQRVTDSTNDDPVDPPAPAQPIRTVDAP